jgi:hypothetical protein
MAKPKGFSAEEFAVWVHRLCMMTESDMADYAFEQLARISEGQKVRIRSSSLRHSDCVVSQMRSFCGSGVHNVIAAAASLIIRFDAAAATSQVIVVDALLRKIAEQGKRGSSSVSNSVLKKAIANVCAKA